MNKIEKIDELISLTERKLSLLKELKNNSINKKYTEEDMIAFAQFTQFSNTNVTDFRKHLKDFHIKRFVARVMEKQP
jgi:ribosomal protein L10